jgi:hypothetical protein
MTMTTVFEVTQEDIGFAMPIKLLCESEQEFIFNSINLEEVSTSALQSDDTDEQIELAHKNIREQFDAKLATPVYFNVTFLKTTYPALTLNEVIHARSAGGYEVPLFVYEHLKSAYAAGHDPLHYLIKHNIIKP